MIRKLPVVLFCSFVAYVTIWGHLTPQDALVVCAAGLMVTFYEYKGQDKDHVDLRASLKVLEAKLQASEARLEVTSNTVASMRIAQGFRPGPATNVPRI